MLKLRNYNEMVTYILDKIREMDISEDDKKALFAYITSLESKYFMEMGNAQRWIPCSEKLPEEGKMVLTTTIGTDIVIQHDNESLEDAIERSTKSPVRVSIGFIGSDGWYGADWFPSIISPSAWMPLPEPWKGEEDD